MRNAIRSRVGSYRLSGHRRKPVAKVWPNGEFTLGYAADGEESPELQEWTWTGGPGGLTEDELIERLECLDAWLQAVDGIYSVSGKLAQLALTLSNAPNSHKAAESTKYGLNGITGYGAKMLRSGCSLVEDKFGCSDVTMATFTVPTLARRERILLAQQWGVLTSRLLQYLTRALAAAGRPPTILGCVEIQTARLESRGEGYLHLHVVWPAHSNNGRRWSVEADDVRAWWKRAIERLMGRPLERAPRVETAIVQKSVEAYLGKYLSKGSDDALGQFVADLGYESVPGQWWFASSQMKAWIKRETLTGRNLGALLEAYIEHTVTEGTGAGFEWLRHVDLNLDGRLVTVGYVGRVDKATRDELAVLLRT